MNSCNRVVNHVDEVCLSTSSLICVCISAGPRFLSVEVVLPLVFIYPRLRLTLKWALLI